MTSSRPTASSAPRCASCAPAVLAPAGSAPAIATERMDLLKAGFSFGSFIANSLGQVDMASPWERAAPTYRRHSSPRGIHHIATTGAGLHQRGTSYSLFGKSLGPGASPL